MKKSFLIVLCLAFIWLTCSCENTTNPVTDSKEAFTIAYTEYENQSVRIIFIDSDGNYKGQIPEYYKYISFYDYVFYDKNNILVAQRQYDDTLSVININNYQRRILPINPETPPGDRFVLSKDKSYLLSSLYDRALFIVNIEQRETEFIHSAGYFDHASFTPDNKIIFLVYGVIYEMNIDGSEKTKLIAENDIDHIRPKCSEDGSKIIYLRCDRKPPFSCDLFIASRDGTDRLILDADLDYTTSRALRFVTQGNTIIYERNKDGDTELWSVDLDGTNKKQLTDNLLFDSYPFITADGSQIVFVSGRDGGLGEIYIMNIDGTDQRRLTDNPYYKARPILYVK